MTTVSALREELATKHQQLSSHPIFSAIQDLNDLRVFMEWHVFAVWDFMSLVKRLQIELTHVTLPWNPPANPRAARLINEIVLGEESDDTPSGDPMSHFDLYLAAMREVGASTRSIEAFVALVCAGVPVTRALDSVKAPLPVARFVARTIETCTAGRRNQVIGSFFYGREDVIPDMFRGLLQDWKVDLAKVPTLVYYLERHIEVDSGEHGPAAERMIAEMTGGDELLLREVLLSGLAAMNERLALWDGLLDELEAARPCAAAA